MATKKRGRPAANSVFGTNRDKKIFEKVYKENRETILDAYRNSGINVKNAKKGFANHVKAWMKQKKINVRAASIKEMHTTAYVSYSQIFTENFLSGIKKFRDDYAAMIKELRHYGITDIRSLAWKYVGDHTYEATFTAMKQWKTVNKTRLYNVPWENSFTIRVCLKNSPEEMTWAIM